MHHLGEISDQLNLKLRARAGPKRDRIDQGANDLDRFCARRVIGQEVMELGDLLAIDVSKVG